MPVVDLVATENEVADGEGGWRSKTAREEALLRWQKRSGEMTRERERDIGCTIDDDDEEGIWRCCSW